MAALKVIPNVMIAARISLNRRKSINISEKFIKIYNPLNKL